IRLSVDGNILFEKKIDTAIKENFEIKTGLYKIESIVEKEKKIPFSTKYVADKELNNGESSVIKVGVDGVIKTTYIKGEDGNLTLDKETKEPAVDKVVKVGVKSTENTKEILSKTVYVADKEKARGLSNERIEGSNGYEKEVIRYTLNENDGTISETVERTEKKATDTIIKVPAKDKVKVTEIPSPVRYEKDSTREKGQNKITIPGEKGTRKVTTMYEVNPKTGEVTERVGNPEVTDATETVVKVAAKDKVEVTETPSPVRYEKDSTREKGQNNITIPGQKGTRKVTTMYEVNPKTGEVTERVGNPEVTDATETVVKVAAKDKVEVVQRENGKKVKVTTVYTVDEKTGNITQTEREEEISSEVITSKSDDKVPTVEELKPFEGGVNPVETVVTEELKPFEGGVKSEVATASEELPELKVAILKDTEGNVLDVLEISAKPKELKGYKYTVKEEVDGEGNKIYIYQKVESDIIHSKKQDTIVINQSQVLKENSESKTEITNDKNDKKSVDKILPNTGEIPVEHGVLGGMLLAATMMLAKRKVKK
uniref:G5 domain-containing protein n=1 Tax=uncultured Gemella sp. TaxID=254352 RepID=UPI0028D77A13